MRTTELARKAQKIIALAKQKIFPGQAAKTKSYRRHETTNRCLTKKFTNVESRVIPSGLEPETYCLEGSCSIQLSYGTDLFGVCGCKGSDFWGNKKILDGKSYICAVIERVIALDKGFCGLEFSNIQGIVTPLFIKQTLRLLKCAGKTRIAVAGEDKLPRTEVELVNGHVLLGNTEAIDHGEGLVLLLHRLQ